MIELGAILDRHPELEQIVERDLQGAGVRQDVGREGMSADQILRALIVKQMNQFSYEELSFHLADSVTYRGFCRLGAFAQVPRKSSLQDNLRRVSAQALEQMNRVLLQTPEARKIEPARKVRIDTTGIPGNIQKPTDSSLLWDTVRVLVREMYRSWEVVDFVWSDHSKRAKRRRVAIISAKPKRRKELYCDLMEVTRRTVGYAEKALQSLNLAGFDELPCALKLARTLPLARQVLDQARRRIVDGEKVPVAEKLLSIFEPDTDLLVKGGRDPIYGHKICLSIGVSSLVLDCTIEQGNPADSALAVNAIKRLDEICEQLPSQAVFDGGFSSKDNLEKIKALGVKDVAFTKHLGLEISEMVRSSWVFKRLRNFRAGVEGCISFLKRAFGLARCTWRGGREGFESYVWSSVLSANLLTLARHQLSP